MAEVNGLTELARRALADLRARKVGFAIVGGFAVSVRSEPRFTRDLDLAVSVGSDAEADALVASLQGAGYQAFQLVEQEAAGRLATVRLRSAGSALVVDLLFASSGIEAEIVAAATDEPLPGIGAAPVATTGHLIALKLLSRADGRPNDAADLDKLLQVATPADLAQATEAVQLIERRNFNRGRDLHSLLQLALRSSFADHQ